MNKDTNKNQCKDTGLAIILILLITILITKNIALVSPAIIALVLTMTAPKLFTPLAKIWFGLSDLMGKVVSKVLLTIVFFLVLTPIGLLRKISGKDAMGIKKWKTGTSSAFTNQSRLFNAKDLEKPF